MGTMEVCKTCPSPCCDAPIISGPNSGVEQFIEWSISEDGEYKKGNDIDRFLEKFKIRLERAIIPTDFFANTKDRERTLIIDGIEVEVNREHDALFFLFRVFFLCPEFQNGICTNYGDRPNACKNFKCEDIGGTDASKETLLSVRMRGKDVFTNINDTLDFISKRIENFI